MVELQVLLSALIVWRITHHALIWVARQERTATHSPGYRRCDFVRIGAIVVFAVSAVVLVGRQLPPILRALCSDWEVNVIPMTGAALLNLEILGGAVAVWAVAHYCQFFAWRSTSEVAIAIGCHPACHWTRLAAMAVATCSFLSWLWLHMPLAFRSLCAI